jgi:RHS repeat-associated protein
MRFARALLQFSAALSLAFLSAVALKAQDGPAPGVASTVVPDPSAGHNYLGNLTETVDPASGSVSIRISVPVPKGRGLTLPFSFAYDSNGVFVPDAPGDTWAHFKVGLASTGGWSYTIPAVASTNLSYTTTYRGHQASCGYTTNWRFVDAQGGRHGLGLFAEYGDPLYCAIQGTFSHAGITYQASIPSATNRVLRLVDADGTTYSSFSSAYGLANVEDRNGNIIQVQDLGGGAFTETDTAGRTILSSSGFGASGNTLTVSGLGSPYQLVWESPPYNFSTDWSLEQQGNYTGCAPLTALSGSLQAIQSITMPNGQQYTFLYDAQYGLLKQVTYPDGGWVKYTWGVNAQSATAWFPNSTLQPNDCMWRFGKPVLTGRTLSFDGVNTALSQTFQYSTVWPSSPSVFWTSKKTIVTTTDAIRGTTLTTTYAYLPAASGEPIPVYVGASSVADTNVPVEQTISYADTNGQVVEVVTKSWYNAQQLASNQISLNGNTPSKVTYAYGAGGQLTEKDEYDFGQSTPSRKTLITYQTFGSTPIYPGSASIFDRPCQTIIEDGNGNHATEIDYFYDGSATATPCSSATTQTLPGVGSYTGHDETNYGTASTPPRGNATEVIRKCLQSCANAVSTYTFDETGQVLTKTDPCGNANCSDMTGSSHTTTFSYADNFDTSPPGNTNAYLTKITNALGQFSTFKYALSDGQLIQSTDANSQTRSYIYNTPPSGCSFADGLRRLSQINYPDGGQTTFCYNDAVYNASTPSPSVTTTKLGSPSPNITTLTAFDGLGHTVRSVLTSDPDCSSGDRTDTTYDGLSRVYKVSNPYCTTGDKTYGLTTYTYDALGRTTQVTHPDNSTILTTYTGRTTQSQDEGNGTQRVTRISQIDGLGRLVSLCEVAPGPFVGAGGASSSSLIGSAGTPVACGQDIAGTGFLTTYQYDALDNLLQVNQSGVAARTFTYDSLSRLISASNPESGATTYSYDANGNLSTKKDARNITTTYSYDSLNRNTQKSYSDGTPTATFIYDVSIVGTTPISNPVGRLVKAIAGSAYTLNFYDVLGRVSGQWQQIPIAYPTLDASYQYDLAGNMISYTNGEFETFTNTYNGAARLISLTSSVSIYPTYQDPPNLLSSVHYNALGAITSDTLGDGETEAWTYNDPRGRLTSYVASLSGSTLYSLTIPNGGYAPNSNILAANDSVNGNWTYSYDPFNRLTGSNKNSGAAVFSYVYDRFGNRWQQNGPNSFIATFTGNNPSNPQNNNRIDGYSYDAAGNLLNDGVHSYAYDAENRITQVDSGATAAYVYNALGQRVEKITPTTIYNECGTLGTVFYFYDLSGHTIVYTENGTNGCKDEVFVGERHLVTYSPGAFFNHADWLGTERLRTTYNGAVCESITSLPFGDGQTTTGYCYHDSPVHFTGKERDPESGLDNFGARYNSSNIGRFMSPDWSSAPMGVPYADFRNPQSLNLYSYAKNNPTTYVDRDGHCFEPISFTVCVGLIGLGVELAYNHFRELHAKSENAQEAIKFEQACASSPQCDINTVHQQTVSAVREAAEAGAETALTTVPIVAPPNGTDEIIHEAGAGVVKDAAVDATKPKEQKEQKKENQPENRDHQQQRQTQEQQQQNQPPPTPTPPPTRTPPPQPCENQPRCP